MYAPSKIILLHSARSRDRTYAEVLFYVYKSVKQLSSNTNGVQKYSKTRFNMHVWPFDDRKNSSILGTIHLRRRHFLGGETINDLQR